jgi:hypothetical protein
MQLLTASLAFLGIPMLMYMAQSGTYFLAGRVGMSLAMVGYSIGNIGLMLDAHGI